MIAGRKKALLSFLLLLAGGTSAGVVWAKKTDQIPYSRLPRWVRDAAARSTREDGHEVTWLHEELLVEPLSAGGVRVTSRNAGRVLRQSGRDVLRRWTVYYRKEDEIVSQQAWNVLPDGTVRMAKPARDVYDRPAIPGYSVFEDSRSSTIEAPGVREGSVVAFESVVVRNFDVGAQSFYFGSLDEPTAYSRFSLRVPPGWSWRALERRIAEDTFEFEEREDGFTMTGTGLRPQPREELRPSYRELLPMVWGRWWSPDGERGFADWDGVARWYEELSSPVMREPGEAAAIGARLRPSRPEELLSSLAEAFGFAARSVRYVSIQVGVGGYRPFSPADVCRLRYGDCKAKAFLMRAIVHPWGLTSYPVLVRTRSRGPLETAAPGPGQFNHVIVAVELLDGQGDDLWAAIDVEGLGRVLFMDPTSNEGSPWDLPDAVQGTTALLVTAEGGYLVDLPAQPPDAAETTRMLQAKVDEQGGLTAATLVETWTGNRAADVRRYYSGKSDDERHRDVLEDLQDRFPGTKIDEYHIEGLELVEDPVVETSRLSGGRLGTRASDLLILEPGKAARGLITGPLPPPPRRWPLNLGAPREERVEISIAIPEGWGPERLPEALHIDSDRLEVHSTWSFADGTVTFRRSARLLVSRVSAEEYVDFRDQITKMQAEEDRAVVFVHRP